MNKIMKFGFLALFVLAMMSSCMDKNARKNNYPAPDIPLPPVGKVYTLHDLDSIWINAGQPTMYTNKDVFKNEDCSLYGIITADETSGNLYKVAFLQERASGLGIELYMNSVTGLRIGDSVRVCLKGATLGRYNGLPQIQDIESNRVEVLQNCLYVEPEITTIADVVNGQHLCQLVTLEYVKFEDQTLTWADKADGNYSNRTLVQCDEDGNVIPGSTIIVRTSTYASFASKQLPQGLIKKLNAIVTVYQKSASPTWQLVMREVGPTEIIMDGISN